MTIVADWDEKELRKRIFWTIIFPKVLGSFSDESAAGEIADLFGLHSCL
jgi:hypothetical protein